MYMCLCVYMNTYTYTSHHHMYTHILPAIHVYKHDALTHLMHRHCAQTQDLCIPECPPGQNGPNGMFPCTDCAAGKYASESRSVTSVFVSLCVCVFVFVCVCVCVHARFLLIQMCFISVCLSVCTACTGIQTYTQMCTHHKDIHMCSFMHMHPLQSSQCSPHFATERKGRFKTLHDKKVQYTCVIKHSCRTLVIPARKKGHAQHVYQAL
jgi:hypothetical protein